jgi:hypothetical protein
MQIKLAEKQLAITQGVAGQRVREAQLGDVAGQAAAVENEQIVERLKAAKGTVADLRAAIQEALTEVAEAFTQAPVIWINAFVDSWVVEAQRMIAVIRSTMSQVKTEMAPTTEHSPSLIQTWDANVRTVKQGINQMGQTLQAGMPNLGQLNMSQAFASQPAGFSPAGMMGGQVRAKEFNDNRRVQMDIHNNVDIDNVKRQVGRSLEQVNMGSAEEI